MTVIFGVSFAVGFLIQGDKGSNSVKIAVILAVLLTIAIGFIIDVKIKKQERSFNS
tara:strand:- start:598 stop:765 length:168 start_codon:yes stop_codon:yes gene_type:complete